MITKCTGIHRYLNSSQFAGNNGEVSLATIRVIDPSGSSSNPFLKSNQEQTLRQQPLVTPQSRNSLEFSSGRTSNNANGNNNHQFVPGESENSICFIFHLQNDFPSLKSLEFIPSVRLPDNFSPNLGSMILHTTDRATLLNEKKMKFPEDHNDYGEINNVLNNQAGKLPESSEGEEAEFEDEEEEDEEEYEDEDVEKVPKSVGKIGRALGEGNKNESSINKETSKNVKEDPDKNDNSKYMPN